MATTLRDVGMSNALIRWKAPYVSDSLNKKLATMSTRGIVRGFLASKSGTAYKVTIAPDADLADHVANIIDDNGALVSVRDASSGSFDLDVSSFTPGGGTQIVILALYVNYTTGSDTVVEIRGYTKVDWDALSAAALKSVNAICEVTVPASNWAGNGIVTPGPRSIAGLSWGRNALPWKNILVNADFEDADPNLFAGKYPVGWNQGITSWPDVGLVLDEAGFSKSGKRCLKFTQGFATGQWFGQSAWKFAPPGTKVHFSAWVRGDTVPAGTTLRIGLVMTDADGANGAISIDESIALDTGTWGYKRIERTYEVPTGKYFVSDVLFAAQYASPAVDGTKIVYVDAVRACVEPLLDEQTQDEIGQAVYAMMRFKELRMRQIGTGLGALTEWIRQVGADGKMRDWKVSGSGPATKGGKIDYSHLEEIQLPISAYARGNNPAASKWVEQFSWGNTTDSLRIFVTKDGAAVSGWCASWGAAYDAVAGTWDAENASFGMFRLVWTSAGNAAGGQSVLTFEQSTAGGAGVAENGWITLVTLNGDTLVLTLGTLLSMKPATETSEKVLVAPSSLMPVGTGFAMNVDGNGGTRWTNAGLGAGEVLVIPISTLMPASKAGGGDVFIRSIEVDVDPTGGNATLQLMKRTFLGAAATVGAAGTLAGSARGNLGVTGISDADGKLLDSISLEAHVITADANAVDVYAARLTFGFQRIPYTAA